MNETIERFKYAMLDAGITPPETVIGDGNLHRFKIDGKLNGAYVLHLDSRAAGYFQDFKQGIKKRWKMAGKNTPLTDAERQAFKVQCIKQQNERQAEEKKRHFKASNIAKLIWDSASTATEHAYLVRKQISPYLSRIYKNTLVVPLYENNGALMNLQFIQPDGTKRFLTGGKKAGCFFAIGEEISKESRTILIAEGFATAASLHEVTGYLTLVAFDAGNLLAIAKVARDRNPEANIIICADNDENGIGEFKARQAAMAINCRYIIPPTAGDFNDHCAGGI